MRPTEILLQSSGSFSRLPKHFQTKSNQFPTSFKTISNQITSPLLKHFNPSYVKMSPIKSQNLLTFKEKFFFQTFFLANLQDIFKIQIIKILGEPQKFLKGQKSKGRIQRSKHFPQISKFFNSKCFHWFCPFFSWPYFFYILNPKVFFSKFLNQIYIFFLNSKSFKSSLKKLKFTVS